MQAEYYSEKSIAVFGETKPWAENLKGLGGKFNANLRGHPGWIFQRTKEPELMQFIAQANQGLIQPTTQTKYPEPRTTFGQMPQMAPFGATTPAMTPQTAMTRLTIAQPTIPQPTPILTPVSPVTLAPKPLSPKPITVLPPQPTTVAFPNTFMAADGLTYQIIIYTAPVPEVNQRVTLTVGENNLEYIISAIQSTTAPIDDILITQVLPETEAAAEPQTSRAIIMNGKWQIHCMQDAHTLTFHPKQK